MTSRALPTAGGLCAGVVGVGILGLGVILAGTFLPWLHSGTSDRNSYQAGGVARRVLAVPGWLSSVMVVWPFIGLLCAAVVALYAVQLSRSAAVLALAIGAGAIVVSVAVLTIRGSTAVSPASIGPAATIVGACILIISSSVLLLRRDRRPTRS
jgi:hypothetical protein